MKLIDKLFNRNQVPESVWFFTFHKCASTLFAGYVLKQVNGLENVNYERLIADGTIGEDEVDRVVFADRGYIYGPVKLSASTTDPLTLSALAPAQGDFMAKRRAIFFTRDPRDILVSQYYSFTGPHPESPVPRIAAQQRALRERMSAMTVDEYACDAVDSVVHHFESMARVMDVCGHGVLTSYEEMVDDFAGFSNKLTRYMSIDPEVMKRIHARSRPRDVENINAHQRSGQVGGFAGKLEAETIAHLNESLAPVLDRFGYSV